MMRKDLPRARRLLRDHVQWLATEQVLFGGGIVLHARWLEGGETVFYSLSEIERDRRVR